MIGVALGAFAAAAGVSLRYTWWRPRKPGVPILMYHQVGPHRRRSPLNHWRVLPGDFERQMTWLAKEGLEGIALRDLLDSPPREADPRVVVTFDDGFAGVRHEAAPVLARLGFSATVFVLSGKLGGAADWNDERPAEPLLREDEVRALAGAGLEIGSHGARHRPLPGLSDAELEEETAGSRARLEELTGGPVTTFCYPFGAFDDRSVEAVKRAGYRAATVIRGGIQRDLGDPFRLKRVAVRGTNTFLDFRLALRRGRSRL